MDRLSTTLEIKALGDDGSIEGYGSTFGNIDQGGDRVIKGAFSKSLVSGKSFPMLWQHDQRQPIGVWNDVKEDDAGLLVKGRLIMEVSRAREAHSLLKAGAINGLSMGYRVKSSRPSAEALDLLEVDLKEISIVTVPMNESARVTAVKAFDDCRTIKDIEDALRDVGLPQSERKAAISAVKRCLLRDVEDELAAKRLVESINRATGILSH